MYGFVVEWGGYLYAEVTERKTPLFTYQWREARVYEDYNDAEKMRGWLAQWDSKQSCRMRDWTHIDTAFRIVKVEIKDFMTNIRRKKDVKKEEGSESSPNK